MELSKFELMFAKLDCRYFIQMLWLENVAMKAIKDGCVNERNSAKVPNVGFGKQSCFVDRQSASIGVKNLNEVCVCYALGAL
ncbi:hypothetical protein D3C80_1356550 [compost metagenome]